MKQTGLLPLMTLNLSRDGVGSLFVMDEDILPASMLQKVDNLDSTIMDYILENRIYCSQVTPSINLSANEASLSLSTPALPYSGTVGKEYNQDFLAVKTPANASDSTTVADFLNVLVYTPKNVIPSVTSYSTATNTVSIPLASIGANNIIETSFNPTSLGQMANLVPNDTNNNLSFTMSESFDAWRQSRGFVAEVNFKDAISTDIILFKCGLSPGASYRPAWNTWTLRLFYYDETTLTWTAVGNSYIPDSSLIAYQMNSITAKRFRFYVGGTFTGTSGSFNVNTRLGLSKLAFGKKNTAIPSVQYSPRTAVFFPSNSLTDLANYGKKFVQSKSVNAVILSIAEDESSVVDILGKPDPFEDSSTLATLPLDSNVDSTYTPVFANTLVDMENALTYVANNNYLGRTVINNNGAFSAHGPLNAAFSATMDAGAGRQWRMKDIVIRDNAVAVPTYPNNPRVHWYVSNDNVTYTPLFIAESAIGERVISLPVEVFARFVRIQHDTHPSNTYKLSAAVYSDNSIAMHERANVVATGNIFGYSSINWIDTGIFLPDINNSNPYKGHPTLAEEVYDFGEEVNIVSLTTRASAGNPGSYPSAPFNIYKKVAGEWILAYTQPNTSSVEVVHSLNFLATAIKFEWVGNLFVKPTEYLAVQTLNSPVGRFGRAALGNGSSNKINTGINITALDNWAVSFHANNLMSGSGSVAGASKGGGFIPKFVLNMNDVTAGRLTLSVISQAGANIVNTANAFTDNDFHHLVLNCVDRTISLYIDGTLAFTVNNIVGQALNPLTFLSEGENWKFFNGAIDQVRVFNRALSTTEIGHLKIESIVTEGSGSQGELAFNESLVAGRRVALAPNSNVIGAEI